MAKQKSLKKKAASGMVWTSIQKFSKTGIRFISGIVLARLLTPFDYGCIGMLTVFITFSESFIDCGFGSALIQKKQPTQTDYSTIFWWNLALSSVMYIILYLSAPAISRFYSIPILCDVLRVQGLILFIYALNLIQRNQLRKKLKFKILAITRIVSSFICLIVTIAMAYMGFGVWALVTQYLLGAAIPAVVYWVYTKWRPSWTYSWTSFRELFSFGFFMFLTSLINNLTGQIQNLLIGRVYDPTTLGYYSKAQSTERLGSYTISGVMTSVTYPLYAEVQDDMPRMHNMIKRLTSTIAYLTFPLLALLILIAKPVFIILYSDRWLESVPYFQLLCIAGIATCISAVNTQPIAAIGKSKVMFSWTIIKRIIGITFIIIGLLTYGMWGLMVGFIINCWFGIIVNIGLVSKYIGYHWNKQASDLLPIVGITLVCTLISYFTVDALGLNIYLDGVLKLLVFVLIYMSWSHFFHPESYTYTKDVLKPMLLKYKIKLNN